VTLDQGFENRLGRVNQHLHIPGLLQTDRVSIAVDEIEELVLADALDLAPARLQGCKEVAAAILF
jgi:hypothetical protein